MNEGLRRLYRYQSAVDGQTSSKVIGFWFLVFSYIAESPEVRSEAEKIEAILVLWGRFDSLVGLVCSG